MIPRLRFAIVVMVVLALCAAGCGQEKPASPGAQRFESDNPVTAKVAGTTQPSETPAPKRPRPYLSPEERPAKAKEALDPATDGLDRYNAVTGLAISGYCRDSAEALGVVASDSKYGVPNRWDAAMGLINFTSEMPLDVRKAIADRLYGAIETEREELPDGVIMTLIEWGHADRVRKVLGDKLCGHSMEVAVLARTSAREEAVGRLWEIYQAAPPVPGTTNVALSRRWHVGFALLGQRDKRGIDILLECLTVKSAPHVDMDSLGGSRSFTFQLLANVLHNHFGYSPGMNAKLSPELTEAVPQMVEWWKAHRYTWDFGKDTVIVRLGGDAEPAATQPAGKPASPPTQPEASDLQFADRYPPNLEPVNANNEFALSNPGYKDRAGRFYVSNYLPKAVGQLATLAGLTEGQKALAASILRAYIFDYLDHYVRDGGKVAPEHMAAALSLMDDRFKDELTPEKFRSFLKWRDDATGAINPLAFIMR